MNWNEKMKELRGKKTVGEVAQAINVSPDTYGAYERGEREPKPLVKRDIAEYFGVEKLKIWNV